MGTRLEALLARGDRRLNAVVERAWRLGARFDAWDEWWNLAAWEQALTEAVITPGGSAQELRDFYLYRRRDADEHFPWDHLHSGVEKRFLLRDARRSQAGEFLSDCRGGCHACGILRNYPAQWTEEWQCPQITN